MLHSAYTYAITNFCMARGHDDARGGHTDRLLFVIDTGCTQHMIRGPQDSMTHYKPSRKKISTAVANGVLWAEGVGTLPVVAWATNGDPIEIDLKDVQLCLMATANLISMSQAAEQGCMSLLRKS